MPRARRRSGRTASIGSAFFATLDVALRAWRWLQLLGFGRHTAAMVNETLARRLFGRHIQSVNNSGSPIGVLDRRRRRDYRNTTFQAHDWDPKSTSRFPAHGRCEADAVPGPATSDPAAVVLALGGRFLDAAPGTSSPMPSRSTGHLDRGKGFFVGTAPLAPLVATGLLRDGGQHLRRARVASRAAIEGSAVRVAIGATRPGSGAARHRAQAGLVALCTSAVSAPRSRWRAWCGRRRWCSFFDPTWPAFVVPVLIILRCVLAT